MRLLPPRIGVTGPSSFQNLVYNMVRYNLLHRPLFLDDIEKIKKCAGVVVVGGPDIGEDTVRDIREGKIVEYCIDNQIPLFGICRGMQLIGDHFNGELIKDLPVKPVDHNPEKHQGIFMMSHDVAHTVSIASDPHNDVMCQVLNLTGKQNRWDVNSFHHQGFKSMPDPQGPEWPKVLAVANDGVIEVMYGRKWIATQFHPEVSYWDHAIARRIVQYFKRMLP